MRLVSIASGSSGNCIYVGSDNSHILVDAGISNKRIEQGLNEIGLKGSELDGIVIQRDWESWQENTVFLSMGQRKRWKRYRSRSIWESIPESCTIRSVRMWISLSAIWR